MPEQQTVHVVVRSGEWTELVNGQPETGDRVEVLGVYTDAARAADVASHAIAHAGWGESCTEVFAVQVDAEAAS